ncbi:hypothetical protein D9M68_380690 [compost metagenome]
MGAADMAKRQTPATKAADAASEQQNDQSELSGDIATQAPASAGAQGAAAGSESLSEGTASANAPGAEDGAAGSSTGQDAQPDNGGAVGDGTLLTNASGEAHPAGASPAPQLDALSQVAQSEVDLAQEPARALVMPLDDVVEGVWVRSVPETFRRAGFRFDRHGVGIALDSLTDEQLDQLVEEPNLVVEFTAFSDQVLE